MRFMGQDLHTFDDKGRLTLPARYREVLENGVVVMRGLPKCLWVFIRQDWDSIAERMSENLNSLDEDQANIGRHLFAHAIDVVPDRQGRVIIPERLRKYAELDGEALIIGVNKRLEIWNPDRWNELDEQVAANRAAMAANLVKAGVRLGI